MLAMDFGIKILSGILLLLLGRRLFWLFVGLIGFLAGMTIATRVMQGEPGMMVLVIGVLAGIVGIFIAIFLQRLAITLAGFLAGGYLATIVLTGMGNNPDAAGWLPVAVGGLIGAVLLNLIFDWALILLSSLIGSSLISGSIRVETTISIVIFLILFIVGVLIQANLMRRRTVVTGSR